MLSYQHAYHAGNHGDVIKHITLVALLEKILAKPKSFTYIDSHAGEGVYELTHLKNRDDVLAKKIIGQQKDNIHPLIKRYQQIIRPFLTRQQYPGSPLICDAVLDEYQASADTPLQNNLHLNELHPTVFEALRKNLKPCDFQVHKRNAFELINALTPPKPNRGLILIDPPYEDPHEYQQLVSCVCKAYKKWPQGIIAIWYPLLSAMRIDRHSNTLEANPKAGLSEKMRQQLVEKLPCGILDIQLHSAIGDSAIADSATVNSANGDKNTAFGMHASGMIIINPPYEFASKMREVMDSLCDLLSLDIEAGAVVNQLRQSS